MLLRISFILALIIAFVEVSCSSLPTREPQSSAPEYNPERQRLLKLAASNGVMFLISDGTIHDVPMLSAGDRCRKAEEGPWVEQVYSVLRAFQAEPKLLSKIHFIEFRRGDRPGAEISKDLDGAVSLVVLYGKIETRSKIVTLSEIPCSDGTMDYLGKELVHTSFDWPESSAITGAVANLPERPKVPRLEYDHAFPVWLAEHLTLVRLTPELAFEKTPSGNSFLVEVMDGMGKEITAAPKQPTIEFWLKELSAKSTIGAGLKFFSFKRDLVKSSGLLVDSGNKLNRKMTGAAEPTYLFVTYRVSNGRFKYAGLAELSKCLKSFLQTYRSPLASMNTYDMAPENFLSPGHSCEGHEGSTE